MSLVASSASSCRGPGLIIPPIVGVVIQKRTLLTSVGLSAPHTPVRSMFLVVIVVRIVEPIIVLPRIPLVKPWFLVIPFVMRVSWPLSCQPSSFLLRLRCLRIYILYPRATRDSVSKQTLRRKTADPCQRLFIG